MGMIEKGPHRVRSVRYLNFIRGKPCLHCGSPGEAHHLTHAQPRAMGKKTGDQWVVPLCHSHHMDLHNSPYPEPSWWAMKGIQPLIWAQKTYWKWVRDHGNDIRKDHASEPAEPAADDESAD